MDVLGGILAAEKASRHLHQECHPLFASRYLGSLFRLSNPACRFRHRRCLGILIESKEKVWVNRPFCWSHGLRLQTVTATPRAARPGSMPQIVGWWFDGHGLWILSTLPELSAQIYQILSAQNRTLPALLRKVPPVHWTRCAASGGSA